MPRLFPRALIPMLYGGVLVLALASVSSAQDVALAARPPRFLVPAAVRGAAPIQVDAGRIPLLRRKVSLDLRSVPLEDALETIARQSGAKLVYVRSTLPLDSLVRFRSDDITVAAALTELLLGLQVDVLVGTGSQIALVPSSTRRIVPGSIVGRVTDTAGRGIAGVEVLLERTPWRTDADSTGYYRLTGVDTGIYTLTARRPGYTKRSQRVTVRAEQMDTVNLVLAPAAIKLDELVTTATGRQRRRDLGNAITTIRADSVLRSAPIRNLTDLLVNRVPGLSVQHTSGAPGDPARLRLRGISSVMRGNDPVVVVDGIRVYATQSAARSGNLTNLASRTLLDSARFGPGNTPAPSPLDQIDPNIIETIEVFKGPSAATLYGADAANGVIVITTKKGKPGPTQWSARLEYGRTTPAGPYPDGYYRWGRSRAAFNNLQICPLVNTSCDVVDSVVRYQALNDPRATIFAQGRRAAVTLTASGGSQSLTYSLTGSYGDESGLVKLPAIEVEHFQTQFNREPPDWMQHPHHYKNWSVSSNVTALLGRTADVTLSTILSRSDQQRTPLESQQSWLAGLYSDTDGRLGTANGLPAGRYYHPSGLGGLYPYGYEAAFQSPSAYAQRTTASTITFTTGLNANWRPRTWFTAGGHAGLNVVPRDDQTFRPSGILTPVDSGLLIRGTGRSLVSTFNLQGTVRRPLRWGFAFETSFGTDLVTTSTNDVVSSAMGLVPGTSSLSGATYFSATDSRVNTSVFGWFIEPRVTGQRLSLSTGIRLDGGSTYGARLTRTGGGLFGGLLGLPKLNGSWVISEEPWFPFNMLFSSLRLRGAYGQAQVQPGAIDRLRTYTRRTDVAGEALDLTGLGNTELRPERSTEFEGGFDADLLASRLSLELTAYRKLQVDALMPVLVPHSVNGGGTIIQNIGNIRNTGLEVTARITPVHSQLLTWSAELNYARNDNTLTRLGPGVEANPQQGIVAGYPVGGRWSRPIRGYADENGDGVIQTGEVRIGDSLVFMGRLLPAYKSVLSTSMVLFGGAIGITAGLSYDAGATQVNLPAADNWMLNRAFVDPSTPLDQQAAAVVYDSTDYGLTQTVSTFRFNTLAINYRAPLRIAHLVGARELAVAVQGDNLGLHSSYSGKDPDVTAWSATEHIVDGGQIARPRTWQLMFSLRY